MSSETIRDFVERREKELRHHRAALEAQLAAINIELDELAAAKGCLGETSLKRQEKEIFAFAMAPGTTIKEMAIQALLDRFPNGTTLVELRDFIHDAYGRDVSPSSLRTQMHRLKEFSGAWTRAFSGYVELSGRQAPALCDVQSPIIAKGNEGVEGRSSGRAGRSPTHTHGRTEA